MTKREIIIVRAGERLIGVFAEDVAGVEKGRNATPLPHAPPSILGIVSVRGRILTLLDPLALLKELNAEDAQAQTTPRFILALRGEEQLALAVDSSERLREISVDEIEAPVGAEAGIAHGAFQDEEKRVVILDVGRLFAAAVEGMEQRRRKRILQDESTALESGK